MLIKEDEVIEHPHLRHDRRYAALLEDRHAGGAVAMKHAQDPALLLRERRTDKRHRREQSGDCGARAA